MSVVCWLSPEPGAAAAAVLLYVLLRCCSKYAEWVRPGIKLDTCGVDPAAVIWVPDFDDTNAGDGPLQSLPWHAISAGLVCPDQEQHAPASLRAQASLFCVPDPRCRLPLAAARHLWWRGAAAGAEPGR